MALIRHAEQPEPGFVASRWELLARTTRDVRWSEVALDMALGCVRAHAVTL